MAFEAIFIELKNLDYVPNNTDKKAMFQLGLDLPLNKIDNQVLVNDFWTSFIEFLEAE
ncbi:hypothetical protein JCM18902_1408 [Psychrobacter sp. JCM 18902]|nr:hypothetical protein JCM18902_1408 [Psychrobacter sp. JCM 18902]